MGGSRGGTGVPDPPPPLKIHKNIGFLNKTATDPLKVTKLPSKHSMIGHHRPAKRHLNGASLAGGEWSTYMDPTSPPPSTKKSSLKLDPLSHNFLDPRMNICYRAIQYKVFNTLKTIQISHYLYDFERLC